MDWDYFKKDLRYEYVKLLLKDLSPVESEYLQFLRSGIDFQVENTLTWYDEYISDLEKLNDSTEWEEYYKKSRLEMILFTFLGNLYDRNSEYIERFYNSGRNLAYNHMNRNRVFTKSDELSLNNLTKYTNTVLDSINSEFRYGVKKSIGKHIDNNTLDDFKKELIELPYTPITTHFSVDNRCIFTTKTEYARSVNTGLLQGYSNYGVDVYDWVTSGLSNVCLTCLEYEANNPYTLNEIINMCPCHVNCVCSVKANLPKDLYLRKNPVVVDLTPKK